MNMPPVLLTAGMVDAAKLSAVAGMLGFHFDPSIEVLEGILRRISSDTNNPDIDGRPEKHSSKVIEFLDRVKVNMTAEAVVKRHNRRRGSGLLESLQDSADGLVTDGRSPSTSMPKTALGKDLLQRRLAEHRGNRLGGRGGLGVARMRRSQSQEDMPYESSPSSPGIYGNPASRSLEGHVRRCSSVHSLNPRMKALPQPGLVVDVSRSFPGGVQIPSRGNDKGDHGSGGDHAGEAATREVLPSSPAPQTVLEHYHASQAAKGTPSQTAAIAQGRSPSTSIGARDSEGNKATPPSVMVASLPPLFGSAKPLANEPNAADVEPLKAGQARMESALTLILAELVKVRAENADLKSQMADLTSIVKEHRPA